MDRRIGCGVCSNAGTVPVRCGEEGAEPEGEALDLRGSIYMSKGVT